MSSSLRRNGMPASCEPCRRKKVRCDHKLPTCTRCQQRRIVSKCFYHPAPLTRYSALILTDKNPSVLAETVHTPSTGEIHYQSPELTPLLSRGYLGPTSFAAEFVANSGFAGDLESDSATARIETSSQLEPYWLNKISDALMLLADFSMIERVVSDFYDLATSPAIPAPFVRNAFPSIRKLSEEYLPGNLSRIVSEIINNTARVFQIPSSTQGCDFHELYTGANCRLEILGIILAQAGRSTQFGMGSGVFTIGGERQERIQFAQKMYLATDIILQVCKMLTSTNDLLVWLVYEHMLLSSIIHGDSSEILWDQLGDLSTRIFALGAHRESKRPPDLPMFLVQSRKRLFASSYQIDKSIATFLGRPPRLPSRHSDCGLPLCISDDMFNASNDVFQQAAKEVDEQGWSTHPTFQPAAWIRLGYSNATFREEILDMSMKPSGMKTAKQLKDISRRCKEKWQSHPGYLQFTPHVWDDNVNASIVVKLTRSYAAYLHNEFLIQMLLVRQHDAPNDSLLSVSAHILSTILLLRRGTRMRHSHLDLASTIQLHGFPAASVLIEALQSEIRYGIPLACTISRAEVVRNLSVFISHIDSEERPTNWNDALFKRASKVFSSIIDQVIEPKLGSNINTIPSPNNIDDFASALNEDITTMDLMGNGSQLDNMYFGMVFDQWLV